ncbi:hypothetical protein niasHS_017421 [Heterodera schachtii]|uniref:protein-histidine N-methyltransferase n=1 Tax=Heterodera schachtii TaxID=97005 RepID=A0ABD2I0E3_HETSC
MKKIENATSVASKLTELWCEIFSRPPPENINKLWEEYNKINNELQLLKLVRCDQFQRQSRLEQIPSFMNWCVEMGIRHSGLDILCSPHGLCLSATEPLEEGAIVAEVPLSAIFSTDVAENIVSLKHILQDKLLQSMENVALAICVAHEVLRGSESQWAAYFTTLPSTFPTPLFYSEEQLTALKPSPVFEESLRMHRAIARQFVYFYLQILGDNGNKSNKCPPSKMFAKSPFTTQNFTFDFYRWCVSVVSTRINMVPSQHKKCEDGKPRMIPALIPFIDMANHANSAANPGSVYFECEKNSVKIQLNKPIVNGEELFIHYGPRTNAKFLLHNGFVPQQPNPDDLFELKIGLHRTSPNFDAKMQHLAAASIVPTNNQPSKNVVFSFQLQMEPSAESIKQSPLFVFAKVFVSDGDLICIDAVQNTQKAIKFVYDRLNLLLRGYKAANQQDSDVFNGSDSQRLKDAEEAILKSHLKCLEEVI